MKFVLSHWSPVTSPESDTKTMNEEDLFQLSVYLLQWIPANNSQSHAHCISYYNESEPCFFDQIDSWLWEEPHQEDDIESCLFPLELVEPPFK